MSDVDFLGGQYAPNAIRPAPLTHFEGEPARAIYLVHISEAVMLAADAFDGDLDIRRAWAACHIAKRAADGDLRVFLRDRQSLKVFRQGHKFWLNGLHGLYIAESFRRGVTPNAEAVIYIDRKRLLELCPPGAALNIGGSDTPADSVPDSLAMRPGESLKAWLVRAAPAARQRLGGEPTRDAVAGLLAELGGSGRDIEAIKREIRRHSA